MDALDRLEAAVRELIELRRSRLASLANPDRDLVLDLLALEQEARKLRELDAAERSAIGEAWGRLEVAFGRGQVWEQYPEPAGLLMALRAPGAREIVVGMATEKPIN